jgi:hypothetical protein
MMTHVFAHYLEIAAIVLVLSAVLIHMFWHGERKPSCRSAGRPTSSSTPV